MSRRKRKLQSFSENPGKRMQKNPPAQTWGWKERLTLAGVPFLFLAIIAGVLALDMRKDRRTIEDRVRRMRLEHNLTESEFHELMTLELNFHSHNTMLSFKPPPTGEEAKAHAGAVTRLLGGEGSEHPAQD